MRCISRLMGIMRGASNVGVVGSRNLGAGAGGTILLGTLALLGTGPEASGIVIIVPVMSSTVWIGARITGVIDTSCPRLWASGTCTGVTH